MLDFQSQCNEVSRGSNLEINARALVVGFGRLYGSMVPWSYLAFAAMGLALVRLLALPRRACTAPDPAGSIEGGLGRGGHPCAPS